MEKIDSKGLYILKDNKVVPYNINDKLKIILCGIPGAFTNTCTNKHLPGFAEKLDKLKLFGVDKVIFVSVNDAYVMDVWNKQHGHSEIDSVSDPLAVFTKNLKKDVDWGDSFGVRSERYALLIENGSITKEFEDPFIDGVLYKL